jgi:hypothetical protein
MCKAASNYNHLNLFFLYVIMVRLRVVRHGRRRKIADYTLDDLKKLRRRIKYGDYGKTYYWGARAKDMTLKEYAELALKNEIQLLHTERKVPPLELVEIRKVEVEKQRAKLKINKLEKRIKQLEESGNATPKQIWKLENELAKLVRDRNIIAYRLDRLRTERANERTK